MYKLFLLLSLGLLSCSQEKREWWQLLENDISESSNKAYLSSPYVTAGDRCYLVGHQDGSFPDLGWHIKGEMGGMWVHPIKILDGIEASILTENDTFLLNNAINFINFPAGNKHQFPDFKDLKIERSQFVPDGTKGFVMNYTITNQGSKPQNFSLNLNYHFDLIPTWLGERSGMNDTTDELIESESLIMVKDSANSWYGGVSSEAKFTTSHKSTKGNGLTTCSQLDVRLESGETKSFPLYLAGSAQSENEVTATLENLKSNTLQLFTNKQNRLATLSQKSKITIPDKDVERAYNWLHFNTDWLIRDVEGVGRGIGAGIPDYPWWFGVDSEYTLQGLIAMGRKDLVYQTIDLLYELSEKTNGNGRIIHEASTNGVVFNPGNINETPQFASLIWQVYEWTGDDEFLKKYFPTIEKGMNWLLKETDKDGNLLPDGFGMMEIHGLNSEMIDVASYTQKAFSDAAKMAEKLGKTKVKQAYETNAQKLKEKINEDFWVEEFESYADFIGTPQQAVHLIDDAIARAEELKKPWAVEELKSTKRSILKGKDATKRGFVVHHNWVVNSPMEVGIADHSKAIKALETAKKYTNPFGVFVTGIDRDETAGTDESGLAAKKKTFDYIGAVMTLPTGVQAIAENNYGRPNQALDYLKRMSKSFSYAFPGAMYEVSPDFGMIVQAWNAYSFAIPIIEQFFGIKPQAYSKTIHINPSFPSSWEQAEIENVDVNGNIIGVKYEVKDGKEMIRINQTQNWEIKVGDNYSSTKNTFETEL